MIVGERSHNLGNHRDDLVTISADNNNIIEGNLSLPNNHGYHGSWYLFMEVAVADTAQGISMLLEY
jgi:hypothetical protein